MPNFDVFRGKIERSDLSADNKAMWSLFLDFNDELNAEKEREIASLKEEVSNLQARLQKIEDKQDAAGQYSRLDTLTLSPKKDGSGQFLVHTVPTYDKAENTKKIVLDLFKDHLKLELADTDISIAHRLPPPRKASESSQSAHDRRNIIIRFCRKDLIGTIFKHCKEMTPPFYVNESLTPLRSNISYALRTLKKKTENVIEKVRSFKGVPQVFVNPSPPPSTRGQRKKSANQTPIRIDITSVLELESFTKKYLNTTLQEQDIVIKNRV